MEQRRSQNRLLRVRHLLLVVSKRRGGARQCRPARAAVLVEFVLVVRSNRERIPVADLVGETRRNERAPTCLAERTADDPVQSDCMDERLLVADLIVGRQHERRLPARPDRSAQEPFDDATLFGRLRHGKRVARVQVRIASDHIEIAVIGLSAWFGENLEATAARSRVLRRVRILIDPNLLNRGGADVQRAHLHAIDDDRDATGAQRA